MRDPVCPAVSGGPRRWFDALLFKISTARFIIYYLLFVNQAQ